MTHDDTMAAESPRGLGGDLPTVLMEQIELHVREHLRPRLDGLTDEEYFFDPSGAGRAWTVHPRAALVSHINRELIHHLAEIALLRDLWAHRG